jgi:signal transduction histidine kinase
MLSMGDAGPALCAVCAATFEQAGETASMGETVCDSQNELRRLSAQILTIQENERRRIATDLHDGLGQSLTMIWLGVEECKNLLAANALKEAEASLLHLSQTVKDAFCELRRIAMDLRPSTLDDLGILATLSWFFRELENTCHGIKIEKCLLIQECEIPAPLKITIFRILQEAVSNIVKHAKANHIRVSLMKEEGMLHLSIEDNGLGFNPAGLVCNLPQEQGIGLTSMKERANFSAGKFKIESVIGQGTQIRVSWPCA